MNAAPGAAFSLRPPSPDNPRPMSRVAFAGLGAMGLPMAKNLHHAGFLAGVWNRSAAKADTLAAELGCPAPRDLPTLATLADIVVICVSADADVRAVVEALAP